jgi:hypothetical protein
VAVPGARGVRVRGHPTGWPPRCSGQHALPGHPRALKHLFGSWLAPLRSTPNSRLTALSSTQKVPVFVTSPAALRKPVQRPSGTSGVPSGERCRARARSLTTSPRPSPPGPPTPLAQRELSEHDRPRFGAWYASRRDIPGRSPEPTPNGSGARRPSTAAPRSPCPRVALRGLALADRSRCASFVSVLPLCPFRQDILTPQANATSGSSDSLSRYDTRMRRKW